MNKIFVYGRIASEPGFFRYEGRDYCEISLESFSFNVERVEAMTCPIDSNCIETLEKYLHDVESAEVMTCLIPSDDIETLKKYIHKGDHIIGDGYIGIHVNYTYDVDYHITIVNVEQFSDWVKR